MAERSYRILWDLPLWALLVIAVYGGPVVFISGRLSLPELVRYTRSQPPAALAESDFQAIGGLLLDEDAPVLISDDDVNAPEPEKEPVEEPTEEVVENAVREASDGAPAPAEGGEGPAGTGDPLSRKPGAPVAQSPRGGKGGKAGGKCDPDEPGIVKVSDTEYKVDRDILDRYASDIAAANRLADVYWHTNKETGERDGFIIRHIRCNSAVAQAGFHNKDVVIAINGMEITTVAAAIVAYERFKDKRTLRVTILREGQEITLKYKLT